MSTSSSVDLPDLRPLDPAVRDAGDRATGPAAQALLSRIVAVPRTAGPRPAAVHVARPRRRAAGAVALTAGATAAVVALPALTGGSGTAFASWTPVPEAVGPAEARQLEDGCLAAGRDLGHAGPATAVLTERRGDFAFTLVATGDAVGSCLVLDPSPPAAGEAQERAASTWGALSDLPRPGDDGTTVLWGASSRSAAGEFTSATGRAGGDVVAVTLTSDDGGRVQAHLEQGWFTAWWPGGPDDELTVTTRLEDGAQRTRTVERGQR